MNPTRMEKLRVAIRNSLLNTSLTPNEAFELHHIVDQHTQRRVTTKKDQTPPSTPNPQITP